MSYYYPYSTYYPSYANDFPAVPQQGTPPSEKKKPPFLLILTIIFIIGGIVFLFLWLLVPSPASTDTSDTGESITGSTESSDTS